MGYLYLFYPRDAMLARVLAMALCQSVSVCVCHSVNVNVNVNVEFTVTLHDQVRYRGTLQY